MNLLGLEEADITDHEEADDLSNDLHRGKYGGIYLPRRRGAAPWVRRQGPFPDLVVHLLACLGVQGRSPGQQAANIINMVWIASFEEVVGCLSLLVGGQGSTGDEAVEYQ